MRSESRRLEGKLVADELNYEEHIAANEQSATLLCEIGQQLEDCLKQLEKRQRQGILMAYYHGFSRDEIAIKLEKPLNTVKS
ncbi:sigma factor-like helix-turn-helix DNA-binding protein, partial [Streptococcus suis]